jgi:apolipoprotein N-acyltransferase
VNSALALIILILTRRRKDSGELDSVVPPLHDMIGLVVVTAGIMVASLIYGRIVIAKPLEGDRIRISVLQGNIPQEKKWDKAFARAIMKTYRDLSLEAARDKPVLIAWPETATPAAINNSRGVRNQVMKILNEVQVPMLIGSAERRKYDLEGMKKFDYTNAAYFLSSNGGQVQSQRYDKIHLLPFGEYLPTKDSIPWHLIGVQAVSGYRSGTEFTVFQLGQYKFSAPICWENIFPYITRNFVKNGAQFIINITNAAYFGRTSAAYQVLSMNVFRAVENRVYVARAANIGISCIIDPCGRVVGRVKDENGEDIFVRGHLTGTVIPLDSKTFYTRHGDVFAWICVGISVVFLLVALVKRR